MDWHAPIEKPLLIKGYLSHCSFICLIQLPNFRAQFTWIQPWTEILECHHVISQFSRRQIILKSLGLLRYWCLFISKQMRNNAVTPQNMNVHVLLRVGHPDNHNRGLWHYSIVLWLLKTNEPHNLLRFRPLLTDQPGHVKGSNIQPKCQLSQPLQVNSVALDIYLKYRVLYIWWAS